MMSERPLCLGVIGLGRAFMLMLPTLANHPRIRLVAAADPREEARQCFAADFGGRGYAQVEELCADPEVEAVYIASPHQFHIEHVACAARHGRHVLVEKPLALSVEDCQVMTTAARAAGVHLIVGHSHSFDTPVLHARALIESGAYGPVRMITAMNFTDFLYRPRRPEELDTAQGGGVVFSQAAHQVDIVRLLGGGRVRSVKAMTGNWDPRRSTEGAYTALLSFEDGVAASLTYSGYGHFDTDELCGWVGELGQERDPGRYGEARAALRRVSSPEEEAALKNTRTYGAVSGGRVPRLSDNPIRHHNHFGLLVASCSRADLRPNADGVFIYGDDEKTFTALPPPAVPRPEVVDELYDAVVYGRPPLHNGEWGTATLEVCLAILSSARTGDEVTLKHQVGVPIHS